MGILTVYYADKDDTLERRIDQFPDLATLQDYVGGYIEMVHGQDQSGNVGWLIVDEEGKLKNKSINATGSLLRHRYAVFQHMGAYNLSFDEACKRVPVDPIVGTVVWIRGVEPE